MINLEIDPNGESNRQSIDSIYSNKLRTRRKSVLVKPEKIELTSDHKTDIKLEHVEVERSVHMSLNESIPLMWSLFNYIKDFQHADQSIIDPFVKLPNKRYYPGEYFPYFVVYTHSHHKHNRKKFV